MEWLNEFFKNPSWIGLIAVGLVLAFFLIRDRNAKKNTANEKKQEQIKQKAQMEKQETAYKTIDRLSDAIELLIENNTNKVNLMTAENIITSTLRASKATRPKNHVILSLRRTKATPANKKMTMLK